MEDSGFIGEINRVYLELWMFPSLRNISFCPAAKIIHPDDRTTAGEENVDQLASDEAGGSGHQDRAVCLFVRIGHLAGSLSRRLEDTGKWNDK